MQVWKEHPVLHHLEVSTHGNVRLRGATDVYVRFQVKKGAGHLMKCIKGRIRYAHQLVLDTFVGPCPPKMECRHLDGNPANNRLENLKWGTSKENAADMVRHGTSCVGTRNGIGTLTEDDVRGMRSQRKEGCDLKSLAAFYGVRMGAISRIITGSRWGHLA